MNKQTNKWKNKQTCEVRANLSTRLVCASASAGAGLSNYDIVILGHPNHAELTLHKFVIPYQPLTDLAILEQTLLTLDWPSWP